MPKVEKVPFKRTEFRVPIEGHAKLSKEIRQFLKGKREEIRRRKKEQL
jgi:hypothetical protein